MATTSAAFSAALAPGIRNWVYEKYKTFPDQYQPIFNMGSSTKAFEKDMTAGGFGLVPKKPKGQGITYDDIIQGLETQYTHDTYAKGFRVEEEFMEDELYGIIKKRSKALGRVTKLTVNIQACSMFNNAFSASYLGADGKALCATDHPRLDGGTALSNRLSTDSDLSPSSIKDGIFLLEETLDERGLMLYFMAKRLIVPSELRFDAKEYLKSDKMADSADNNMNSLKGELEPYVWNFLTDADAWFIQADEHELHFIWRKKPVFKNSDDFDTGDALFSVKFRMSYGWTDWRGVIGTPGAA